MPRSIAFTLVLVLALTACGGGSSSQPEPDPNAPLPDSNDPAYAASFDGQMDPRVSTSRGVEGGVVVLWPRVVTGQGADASEEASAVQSALRTVAERVVAADMLDVRPDPERACPQSGCAAAALGAVVLKSGSGCAVVATISRAGTTPARLFQIAGEVQLENTNVPFREPPERHIRVVDFVPCSDLATSLVATEPEVEQAVREAIAGQGS